MSCPSCPTLPEQASPYFPLSGHKS